MVMSSTPPAAAEGSEIGLIDPGVIRIDPGQTLRQCLTDLEYVARIKMDMRIPSRMHVALCPIEDARHVQADDLRCRFEIAVVPRLDQGIAGFAQDHR